jgi:4a-hydroxytetrahydrobiopterin dehydratase
MGPSSSNLADRHCVPCKAGTPALKGAELEGYASQVPGWTVVDQHHLARSFKFPDFKQALEFVNRAGAIAEEEGHHPNLALTWGRADVEIYTHSVDGLTESDFVLAAKIGRLAGA